MSEPGKHLVTIKKASLRFIGVFLESLLLMVSLVTPAASAMSLMAILFLAISARRFSNAIFVLAMLASLLF